MFGYGFVSVVLVLYLAALGMPDAGDRPAAHARRSLGDAVISLWLTTHADRIGRRRVLLAGALLMCSGGRRVRGDEAFVVLALAATIGVISPSGNEVGPFLAVEQASLVADDPGSRADARLRLVQPGRLVRDRGRGPGRRRRWPGR